MVKRCNRPRVFEKRTMRVKRETPLALSWSMTTRASLFPIDPLDLLKAMRAELMRWPPHVSLAVNATRRKQKVKKASG